MSVRIVDIREITKPISSPIRNAYIDFTKMTTSLVAVVTDAVRDGRRVVGYGFNSNGRYGRAPCKGGAFQWVQIPSGNRSSRKQSEQSWR